MGAILNRHPRPGEETVFFGPDSRPYQFDYTVIALVPGLSSARHTLILAGITARGTQAAAEFVCREQQVRSLMEKLQAAGAPFPVSFECLIKVKVSGGVPVHPEILSLRVRKN